MAEVLAFTGRTILDIPVDTILEKSKEYDLEQVLVLGWTKEGNLFAAGSSGDKKELHYLVGCFDAKLMAGNYDDAGEYDEEC